MIKSEALLVEKIKSIARRYACSALTVEIGDDCAAFTPSPEKEILVTADMSVENTHFIRGISSPRQTGWKCMAANISDIAAMGGIPKFAFVTAGLPRGIDESYALEIFEGMASCAAGYGATIAGGDTTRSEIIVLSVTLTGEAEKNKIIKRNGAKPGDSVYLTGSTGDSSAGLKILLEHKHLADRYNLLVKKHLAPDPANRMMTDILALKPSSMIDISDGLLIDLSRICTASGTGFLLNEESIPMSDQLKNFCGETGLDQLRLALSSGEEYQLLFSAPDAGFEQISASGSTITKIGVMTGSGYFISHGGIKTAVSPDGYDHFIGD